jgi:hypothetical protein
VASTTSATGRRRGSPAQRGPARPPHGTRRRRCRAGGGDAQPAREDDHRGILPQGVPVRGRTPHPTATHQWRPRRRARTPAPAAAAATTSADGAAPGVPPGDRAGSGTDVGARSVGGSTLSCSATTGPPPPATDGPRAWREQADRATSHQLHRVEVGLAATQPPVQAGGDRAALVAGRQQPERLAGGAPGRPTAPRPAPARRSCAGRRGRPPRRRDRPATRVADRPAPAASTSAPGTDARSAPRCPAA